MACGGIPPDEDYAQYDDYARDEDYTQDELYKLTGARSSYHPEANPRSPSYYPEPVAGPSSFYPVPTAGRSFSAQRPAPPPPRAGPSGLLPCGHPSRLTPQPSRTPASSPRSRAGLPVPYAQQVEPSFQPRKVYGNIREQFQRFKTLRPEDRRKQEIEWAQIEQVDLYPIGITSSLGTSFAFGPSTPVTSPIVPISRSAHLVGNAPSTMVIHCPEDEVSELFVFMRDHLPNLKVVTAPNSMLQLGDLVRLADRLEYFECYHLSGPKFDDWTQFHRLIGFDVRVNSTYFCLCRSSSYSMQLSHKCYSKYRETHPQTNLARFPWLILENDRMKENRPTDQMQSPQFLSILLTKQALKPYPNIVLPQSLIFLRIEIHESLAQVEDLTHFSVTVQNLAKNSIETLVVFEFIDRTGSFNLKDLSRILMDASKLKSLTIAQTLPGTPVMRLKEKIYVPPNCSQMSIDVSRKELVFLRDKNAEDQLTDVAIHTFEQITVTNFPSLTHFKGSIYVRHLKDLITSLDASPLLQLHLDVRGRSAKSWKPSLPLNIKIPLKKETYPMIDLAKYIAKTKSLTHVTVVNLVVAKGLEKHTAVDITLNGHDQLRQFTWLEQNNNIITVDATGFVRVVPSSNRTYKAIRADSRACYFLVDRVPEIGDKFDHIQLRVPRLIATLSSAQSPKPLQFKLVMAPGDSDPAAGRLRDLFNSQVALNDSLAENPLFLHFAVPDRPLYSQELVARAGYEVLASMRTHYFLDTLGLVPHDLHEDSENDILARHYGDVKEWVR